MKIAMRAIVACLLALEAVGCKSMCDNQDQAAAMARGLSQARLTRLYDETRAIASKKPAWTRVLYEAGESMPKEWRDLQPFSVEIDADGTRARFHLAGCFDDKTVLLITAMDDSSRARITLVAGEWQPEETLWRAALRNDDAREGGRRRGVASAKSNLDRRVTISKRRSIGSNTPF